MTIMIFTLPLYPAQRTDHLEGLGTDRRVMLQQITRKLGGRQWSGFISFRKGMSGRLIYMVMIFQVS